MPLKIVSWWNIFLPSVFYGGYSISVQQAWQLIYSAYSGTERTGSLDIAALSILTHPQACNSASALTLLKREELRPHYFCHRHADMQSRLLYMHQSFATLTSEAHPRNCCYLHAASDLDSTLCWEKVVVCRI